MNGVDERFKDYFRLTVPLLDYIKKEDIEHNCSVCPKRRKVEFKDTMYNTLDNAKSVCKFCIMSVVKRKLCFKYVEEFFNKFNKTYFTVLNIKKYILSSFIHGEVIITSLKIVIRDLYNSGIMEIYNKGSNNIKYILKDKKSLGENYLEAITRGFGFEKGIKKEKIES